MTNDQKKRLIETFSRLSISTYAHNFSSYAGERFDIVSVKETPRKDKLIRTRLVEADGNEVSIDYVLRRRKERWLIVNIIAEGVSDLALKRSEYSSVLRREGFDVLIVKLEEKINKYSSSKSE